MQNLLIICIDFTIQAEFESYLPFWRSVKKVVKTPKCIFHNIEYLAACIGLNILPSSNLLTHGTIFRSKSWSIVIYEKIWSSKVSSTSLSITCLVVLNSIMFVFSSISQNRLFLNYFQRSSVSFIITHKYLKSRISRTQNSSQISWPYFSDQNQNPVGYQKYHCKHKWNIFTIGFKYFVFIGPFRKRIQDPIRGPKCDRKFSLYR